VSDNRPGAGASVALETDGEREAEGISKNVFL
jgi:hypothetical protein